MQKFFSEGFVLRDEFKRRQAGVGRRGGIHPDHQPPTEDLGFCLLIVKKCKFHPVPVLPKSHSRIKMSVGAN